MKNLYLLYETYSKENCIRFNHYKLKKSFMKNLSLTSIFSFLLIASSYGQCIKGNCHKGHGTFTWENGDMYIGSWINGLPNGHGDFIWENGDNYKGNFEDGKMNGQGRYKWKTGNTYNGYWKENKMNGRGTFSWAKEGATFEGFFQEDKITNTETDDSQSVPESKD